MVIAVNGWMNHPSGFRLSHGKVVDVHPFKALFENSLLLARAGPHVSRRLHRHGLPASPGRMRSCGCAAAGAATSTPRSRSRSPIAALAAPVQVLVGDWNGREVARYQPTKLAALEGLPQTTKGAPIHVLGWYSDGRVEYGIGIPKLLSLLAYHRIRTRRCRASTRSRPAIVRR